MDEFIEPGILCLCFHKKLKVRRFSGLDTRSMIVWCPKCQKGYLDWVIRFSWIGLYMNSFFSFIFGFMGLMVLWLVWRSW